MNPRRWVDVNPVPVVVPFTVTALFDAELKEGTLGAFTSVIVVVWELKFGTAIINKLKKDKLK